jgi:hypothetical protein
VRRRLAALLLGIALALCACGVPTTTTADPADDVPFGLLDPDRGSPSGSSGSGVVADLYLHDRSTGRLLRLAATVDGTQLADVVFSLQRGALVEGSPGGNPLADADVIRSVDLARGLATIDLSEAFADLGGADQLVALAEIVYTATARPGVGQVLFTLEGEPIEIPRGDGSLSSDAVTRGDFPSFAPLE